MATDTIVILPNRATATQIVAAGDGPTLITNTDLNNTVFLGDTDVIRPNDATGVVPLGPNGSVTVNGQSDLYAVNGNAAAVTIATLTGGLSNFLSLTQGLGNLVIPSVQSPNFVHNVSGWQITKTGNSEFNSLALRGTFFGLDFIINSSGIFIYSGTPALGNLVGSWCPVAVANDGLGNAAFKDLTVYNPGTSAYVNMTRDGAAGGNDGILFNPAGATHVTGIPQVSGRAINNGLVNEIEILQLTSGIASGLASADISLQSRAADGSVSAQIQQALSGTVLTTLLQTAWNISVPISCTLGTPSSPSVITNGGYTRIASPFSNGWVSGGGGTDANGIIYRMLNDGNYEVWFDIINPGAQVNSVITNLPAPFRPQKNFKHEWAGSLANSPWVQFNTNGDVVAVGNTLANAEINGRAVVPTLAIP